MAAPAPLAMHATCRPSMPSRSARPGTAAADGDLLTPKLVRAVLDALTEAARLPRANGVHPEVTVRFRASDVQLVTSTDHTCQTFR